VESVVDTAMLSESPSSLNESMINHALVCRSWSEIVHQPLFRREAKSSDVNKASTVKAKAKAKAMTSRPRPRPRPHTPKAKAKAMASRPRPRPRPRP